MTDIRRKIWGKLPDGTRKYLRGKTQEELDEKVLKAQILVNSGVDICSEETFGHFAQMWYDIYKKPYLRESSLNMIKYVLNQHILPFIGGYRLRDISPMQIQAIMASVSDKSNSLQSRFLPEYARTPAGTKMLGTISVLLRGIPFIYQGQEIGMQNAVWNSIDEFDDISTKDQYHIARKAGLSNEEALEVCAKMSRDNARTPMQWSSKENAGFTTGMPWLKVNSNYKEINVKSQEKDADSVLNYYRKLVKVRKSPEYKEVFTYGQFEPAYEDTDSIMAYYRFDGEKRVLVAANFGKEADVKVWMYNNEDIKDPSTLYSIPSVTINGDLLKTETKLPHMTQSAGQITGVAQKMGEKLIGLWDENIMQLNPHDTEPCTFNDFYNKLVSEVGSLGSIYKTTSETMEGSLLAADNKRQQIIGVSTDEELTNMIKYQNAYNAASRYINVVAEMIDTLLNCTR